MTQRKSTYIKQTPSMCKGHVLFDKSLNHTHLPYVKKKTDCMTSLDELVSAD